MRSRRTTGEEGCREKARLPRALPLLTGAVLTERDLCGPAKEENRMLSFHPVNEGNFEACSNLKCTEEQRQFTNSPVWPLLQSAYTSIHAHCK